MLRHHSPMALWATQCQLHIGDVHYQPGGEYGPRIQRNLQLVYVWDGEVTVWVDGTPVDVHENESVLLMPLHRERFRFARNRQTHHGWCEVVEPIIDPNVYERLESLHCTVVPTPALIRRLSTDALALRADPRWSARAELTHLCSAILHEFFRASGLPDPTLSKGNAANTPAVVMRALDLIHREYARLSGAQEIASLVGVSPQHLNRLFREHVGSTPSAYLWQLRTERATDLVTATGLPFTQIASQTGFRTPFHMSRRIHAASGTSPRELRRR